MVATDDRCWMNDGVMKTARDAQQFVSCCRANYTLVRAKWLVENALDHGHGDEVQAVLRDALESLDWEPITATRVMAAIKAAQVGCSTWGLAERLGVESTSENLGKIRHECEEAVVLGKLQKLSVPASGVCGPRAFYSMP